MATMRQILRDERGLAVVMAMIALLTLTALVLAFLAVSAFEPQISANLTAATQARYLAEAGVEAAFDGLANATNWDTALVGATCTAGVIAPATSANTALPGLTTASGSYTVLVRNDCNGGGSGVSSDSVLTGVALESAANAADDTNNRLIVISTGTLGNATRTVKVVIKKVALPTMNAALAFPGLSANVDFSGSAFTIRGVDTQMGVETNGSGSAVYGISVGVASNEPITDNALANNQQNNVSGKDQTNPSTTTTGSNSVAYDTTLASASVTDFVNSIKANADVTINAQGSTYSVSGVGSTCATSPSDTTCWGTTSAPKIVYVKGDGAGHGLSISGTSSGTGVLIVENGILDITGSFSWNGPIIVTGANVKVRYMGGGNRAIWGSVIVNETSSDGTTNLEADIAGNAKIYYSTQALDTVMNGLGGRKLMSLYSWQEQ